MVLIELVSFSLSHVLYCFVSCRRVPEERAEADADGKSGGSSTAAAPAMGKPGLSLNPYSGLPYTQRCVGFIFTGFIF